MNFERNKNYKKNLTLFNIGQDFRLDEKKQRQNNVDTGKENEKLT